MLGIMGYQYVSRSEGMGLGSTRLQVPLRFLDSTLGVCVYHQVTKACSESQSVPTREPATELSAGSVSRVGRQNCSCRHFVPPWVRGGLVKIQHISMLLQNPHVHSCAQGATRSEDPGPIPIPFQTWKAFLLMGIVVSYFHAPPPVLIVISTGLGPTRASLS